MAAPAKTTAAAPGGRRAPALALAFLMLSSIAFVNGTHFRYGTISWLPRSCDPQKNTQPVRASPQAPTAMDNCSPSVSGGVVVEFTVKLAFRRDYTWGEFFGERWSNSIDQVTKLPKYDDKDGAGNFQQFQLPLGQPVTYYQTQFDQGAWRIKFPSGYASSYQPLPASGNPFPGHTVIGSNANGKTSGRICANPYDTGLLPQCNTTSEVPMPTDIDPRTGGYIPYFPYLQGAAGGVLPTGLEASCSCSYNQMIANYGTCATGCQTQCTLLTQSPAFVGGSTICAPWAYAYGFFTGVEVDGGDPDYSKTLEITLTDINMDTNSKIGNFIQGQGRISQQYPSALGPSGDPWVAYFTGGDRIGKARGQLQNNYGGRFRLEISVNLQCHVSKRCWQKSARATSLPVVPIPYTARNGNSLYDYNFATFRISAYDPDIGDDVYFYHASNQKYGVHRGHGIPEGDYPNNPSMLEYNVARNKIINDVCSGNCNNCAGLKTITGPGGTVANVVDFCSAYPEWNVTSKGMHTSGPPPRMMIDAYTGVVHWQTGPNPFQDDLINQAGGNVGGYLVPPGFNPGAVGTPYVWDKPGGAVYDGWVYDTKTFSYMRYSEFSKCGGSGGDYSGVSCTTSPLSPGFYNLVLDIRSQSGDACLARDIPDAQQCMGLDDIMAAEAAGRITAPGATQPSQAAINMQDPLLGPWTPQPGQAGLLSRRRGYNTVPLDFLLYLYPAMSMCSNCSSASASPSAYVGKGVVTYKDSTGTYGFDKVQGTIIAPNVDKYVHKSFEGTGRCVICGGSDTNATQNPDPAKCLSCLVPNTDSCKINTRPFWINKDYTLNDDPFTPAPQGWGPSVKYPVPGSATVPEWGALATAQLTAFKGTVVEFDLVAGDEDECVELWIYDTGLYRGDELDFCNENVNPGGVNKEACTILDPPGGVPNIIDDQMSNQYSGVNLFDMYLGPHQPAYIPNYNGTKPSVLGQPGKTVRRHFQWPAQDTWPASLKPEYDPRPVDSTVCFFAFDGYLFSDFRCIRITLNTQQQIYWSDRRPGLDPNHPWNVVQDQKGFNTGTFTDIVEGNTVTINAPLTLANQTRIVANVGDLITFQLQAKQASGYDPLDMFISQGVLPEGATFEKYVPTSASDPVSYDSDPVRYTFSWRPKKGQECNYQICFLATNTRGSEYPMTVGYSDLVTRQGPKAPSIQTYTPATSTAATAPFIDERCYTIEVTDMAAHLKGGAYVDVTVGGPSLVAALAPDCGYSFGGWFQPEATAEDMILASIGTKDVAGVMTAAHQLRWMYEASSDDVHVGTDSVGTAGTGKVYRSLAFYEAGALVAHTSPVACDGGWHYFFVTVDTARRVRLYLDGVELEMAAPDSHEFFESPSAAATVAAFPSQVVVPPGSSAAFRIGADHATNHFDGWLNDLRVYSRALTAAEVKAQMFATCTNDAANAASGECLALEDPVMAAAAKEKLELWLNFNDANNDNPAIDRSGNPVAPATDPSNPNIVHGTTVRQLPLGASFSRYLSCGADRDTRDLSDWGGTFEYCNDYVSLIGDRPGSYYPDIYNKDGARLTMPKCPVHMCLTKVGPAVPLSGTFAGSGLGYDRFCSYQCADADNSFHGSRFDDNIPNLQQDSNRNPFVSSGGGNVWQVVGDLTEMDTPYAPYHGEMTMRGVAASDRSGRGRRAQVPATFGIVGASATFEYRASPAFSACPAIPKPNVVHVAGGQEVVLTGANFAESQFLRCHWSGMGSTPARVVEYDNRGDLQVPRAVACRAPGGFGAATASALEVSNDGASFTDFKVPVYFAESAAYFDGTKLLEMDPAGSTWLSGGLSVGVWFNMHEPPATRANGLPVSKPVQLFALEWAGTGATDNHLVVGYNTLTLLNGQPAHSVDVLQSGIIAPAARTFGTVEPLGFSQGSTGWHYLMVTVSASGNLTLFLDGVLASSASVVAPKPDAKIWVGGRVGSNPTQTGTSLNGYAEYVGYMDRLSIFTKVVAPCEMRRWMWGNLTRGYGCPSGEPEEDGVSKDPYQPLPSGLAIHFGFDGLYYNHGSRVSASPMDAFSTVGWTGAPYTLRYRPSATGEAWRQEPTDGALVSGALTNGALAGGFVDLGFLMVNVSEPALKPELKFVTVPYLPPSFNAPRRKVCGSVYMATSSRAQAVNVVANNLPRLSTVGNFMSADVNFLDSRGDSGYSGSVSTLAEPAPVPNRCEQVHQFLVDSVVPVEGYALPEPWMPSLSRCKETGVAVYGFGFAKSPWLQCLQGDLEGDHKPTSAHFINAGEVRCTAAPTDLPYKYSFAVANNHAPEGPEGAGCEDAPEAARAVTPEPLITKDASLYFDGQSTYAMAEGISSQVNTSGVTFGAWFFPTRDQDGEQEPIVAFATECGAVVPLFNGADGAPPAAIVVGATYSAGRVCLTSDLPYYSKQAIPAHEILDLPTKWDSTYGLLDTTNSSLCLDAAPGQWHYVEVRVDPREILIDIPSDEPKVSYLATLTVDGESIGGDEDGDADSSLRVPALPVDRGGFFIGGVHCPTVTATANTPNPNAWVGQPPSTSASDFNNRFFQGMIDEVRVYRGSHAGLSWLSKAGNHSDLVAYYTFGVTHGDNQRRQTPHCDEFADGDAPPDCLRATGAYARAVEAYWVNQPSGLRSSEETLATYPFPTGYYPVARDSPLRPFVYPQLVTHVDPVLAGGGNDPVDLCDTPTVSDATYAGASKAHHNLASDAASLPLDFSRATKHPYAQGGPTRYSQFIPADNRLYNYRLATGGDMTKASVDGTIYQGSVKATAPDYRYMEVPWFAATIEGVSADSAALDAGRDVVVSGFNVAPSKWLSCKFRGVGYRGAGELAVGEEFASYQDVMSHPVGFMRDTPGTVTCRLPGTTDPADPAGTAGSDWLKVPGMVSLQLVGPKAEKSEVMRFREMGLSLGGNLVTRTSVDYASDNFYETLRLECPAGLRFDRVLFASYGRPQNRCNKQRVRHCNGTVEVQPCDWRSWAVTKSCDSDHKKPSGFTAGVVASYCLGRSSCSIPAKDEVFGDPCSGRNKWLAVALECSDRWTHKDYAMLSDARAASLGALLNPVAGEKGEYTFSAWVRPDDVGQKGQQAVASFGCKDCAKMNRGVLQWVGLGDHVGMFHYYDDYINDVIMKSPKDGSDIILAAGQWYHVAFAVQANNDGALYLNGVRVASFTTASRPVGGPGSGFTPTFTLGMDLDDQLSPKEFFQGLVDEVRIFRRALSDAEVFSTLYWTLDMGGSSALAADLAAYYKFNSMEEQDSAQAWDETPNGLHLTLARSAVDVWDAAASAYDVQGCSGTACNHVALVSHGAAWFPATTYALDGLGPAAPLGAGLAEFHVHGVNFVPSLASVHFGGRDVTEHILSISDTVITMSLPQAPECDGGNSSVFVTNVQGGISLAVPEETVAQKASVPDLQSGLVCYFPFFGGAQDWSGNGYDAEVVDGAELTTNRNGLANHAYAFDGGDVIRVPDCVPSPLTGKTISTVAMWVRYADIEFPSMCGSVDPCSAYPAFEGEIGFQGCVMEDHAVMTNAWKLIAGVAGPSGTKIYVNGEEVVSGNGKLPAYLDIIHRVMTTQEIGGEDFVGKVDDVWIYDRPLCAAEVMKLYTTQTYAVELSGEGGLAAPVMQSARLGSPGVRVTLVTSTATSLGSADDSTVSEMVVEMPPGNPFLVARDGTGVLDSGMTVPDATATDAYSLKVEGSVFAPTSGRYTLAVTASDEVVCALTDDAGAVKFTINSGQRDNVRTMERTADLMAGEWYRLACSYTKVPNINGIAAKGHFGMRWNGAAVAGPHWRTGGASELVAAAWVHPYAVEGRHGVLSLGGASGEASSAQDMVRFGLSIVDGSLSAAFYTAGGAGSGSSTCGANHYREVRSWKSAVAKDKWQHVAVAYDGKTMTFFVDGRETDRVTYASRQYVQLHAQSELVVGADASSMGFEGQVYSVAMYNKVPAASGALAAWVRDLWECPIDGPEDNLILNLMLNEGVGSMAKDFSARLDLPDLRVFGDARLDPMAEWVDATCGSLGTAIPSVEYAGQALSEGLAGQCMVFSIQAHDKCGTKRLTGGDNFTVEVVGPLHLHSEVHLLTVGSGVEDMGDGSYLVHFTREISGYYLVYVKLDGEVVPNAKGEVATKTYVHPFVTDPNTTYMYDEEDMLGLDELHESCAGVPVAFMVQTVDRYKNLRTKACDTDAFSVSFDGPYSFDGKVKSLEDGTYRVNYNAEVAGPYQMRVTASVATRSGVEDSPVFHYGGRTCAGWGKSELDYCTLYDLPEVSLSGADYPICLQVHECGSLRTYKDSIYASFPDTDDLDLEGPFTMAAWVKPVPEPGQASRQYILSKQSEYSGKGYWLALKPTASDDMYTLEMGVYVGSENYRIISETSSIPAMEWSRVGATYDGQVARLYVNGVQTDEDRWDDEAPAFQRRNAQPLRVGKAFSGMIDNVMLFSQALPGRLLDVGAGRCPAVTWEGAMHEHLVAYYRFNEGATRDVDGQLVAQNNAWATKDSSAKGNDGFVGLFSDETGQNKEMTIRCPPGYVVSEVLFANYGSSKGGYGTYEVDECSAANSMSFVEGKCLGKNACKVLAAYTNFGNPCKHASKTLAVNAICALPVPDATMASWAIGDPAPHWVGTAAPPTLSCPFGAEGLPSSFHSALPLLGASCASWDITSAVAGEPEYFLLRMLDKCGYKNRYPQAVDSYTSLVDTTVLALLDAADPYEPVFQTGKVSASLTYPHEFIAPAIDQCGIAHAPEAPALGVEFLWGGAVDGFDTYCSRYRDLYLGKFTPEYAHEEATLHLSLARAGGAEYESMAVDVAPAAIDAAASTTCAPTEAAPECADGCMDIRAEAGVEAMFEFVAKDRFGNQRRTWDDLPDLSLAVQGGQSAIHTVYQGSEEGVYEFYVIFPHAGEFTVTVQANGEAGCSFMAAVSPAVPHAGVIYGAPPAARFEHTMVEYESNLYVFGGAGSDKNYLAETLKFTTGYRTFAQGFHYRRIVSLSSGASGLASPHVVEVHLPTKAWMEAGKLQADCDDLLFLDSAGQRMDFWVEPRGAPYGCGANTTKLWVRVAAGALEFDLYYGNKGFASYSSPGVFSKDGKGMFEDFEFEESPLDRGWVMDGAEHDTCSPLELGNVGDAKSFTTTMEVALSGDRSLMVDAYSMMGGSIKRSAASAALGKSFILKGFFYDTMCTGFHYLSPDFDACRPVENAKSMLPDHKTGLGVYTDSKADQYCHTYPWIKSGAERSVGWHSFTFVGTASSLKLYVDEALVSTTEPSDLSSMFIAGGTFVDDVTGGTVAYWDSLLVTGNHGVTSSVAAEEAVKFDEAQRVAQVGVMDPPPARQAHSAVVYGDAMYVFGGERSAYEYSDIWKYKFESDAWEFVAPRNSSAALGRHDHSAVVYGDVMYVYGGRSPAPLGDFWAYDFQEGTWNQLPTSAGMAPRFGHGAAIVDGKMYVYGGYVQGAEPGLTDEIWSYDFDGMAWTQVGPRVDNFMQGSTKAWIADPNDAMQFPQMLPEARFSSVLLGRSARNSFYAFGGAGGDSMMDLLDDVAGFSADAKEWTTPHEGWADAGAPVSRYDAAGALIDDVWACVYGGLGQGEFLMDMVCLFVGDKGLSASA